MGRQCNRNSFHKGEQLSAWLVCYGTKSQLRIQLVLELRVQKPEVQNIVIPENTTLLPESICVAVVRDSRDVCWADGKRETSSSSVLSWETPKRCAETMLWSHGSCSERGLSVLQGEGSSCSLCAMYWDTLCSGRLVCMQLKRGKKKNSARVPVSSIRTNASFVGDLYFKFYPGKWGGHPGCDYSSEKHFFQPACLLRNPLGRKLFGLVLDILWNWTSTAARNWKKLFNF